VGLIAGFGAFALLTLVPASLGRRVFKQSAKHAPGPPSQGDHPRPGGLQVEAAGFHMQVPWALVEFFGRGKLGLTIGVAGSAWTLPRSSFASDGDMAHTASLIESWRAAAKKAETRA
jgi:hypothetical protein